MSIKRMESILISGNICVWADVVKSNNVRPWALRSPWEEGECVLLEQKRCLPEVCEGGATRRMIAMNDGQQHPESISARD